MSEIRVASFNIRNGRCFDGRNSWPFRRGATAEAVAALDAHVVALQEVYGFQLRSLCRQLPDYVCAGDRSRSRLGWGERCPILVRRAGGTVISDRTLWFGDDPLRPGSRMPKAGFPRIATLCKIRIAGLELEVANTHFDERVEDNRVRSAHQLVEWLDAELPRVVAGDLNVTPDSDVVRVLENSGLREALPAEAPGTAHQFTGRIDGPRIDHILVSDHFEVVKAEVDHSKPHGRLASDHWPIVADLRQRN